MKIIKVEQNIIKVTSLFAQNVFVDYYSQLLDDKTAPQYMADLFLSPGAIEKLINDGAIFKIVMDNDEIVGFTEYKLEEEKVFLSKLYVRKDKRGQGIGKLMLNDCIEYTKANNKNKIYLTVNKGNTPSINMYKHIGFKQIDSIVTDIGDNYVMDDYVLQLTI